MKAVKLSLCLLLACSTPAAFSDDNSALTGAAIQSIRQNPVTTSATTQANTSSNAVRDTTTTKAPTQNTINQAADTGRGSQNSGAMMNMVASAALFASCFASCPKCRMELCAMGAMAAAQGAHQAGAAKASDATYDMSEFNPNSPNYTGPNPASVDPSGNAGFTDPNIKAGIDKLAESGYTVTADGVTFPDGSFQPSSAFNSGSSMVAAGMDPAAARAADDVMAAINGELSSGASVASMGVESGGGYSAGGGGGEDFGGLESFTMAGMKNPFSKVDEKKLLAGKSMMVGGEPIGVKGDNIFDMVHRAYQKKRGKNQFLETQKGSLRLPTSLTKE